LAQDGAFRRISPNLDELKTRPERDAENTGKTRENIGQSGPEAAPGEVPERLMGPVSKTGVPSAQLPAAASTCENPAGDLGAFLGALAELAPDASNLAAVLAAWPALPDALKVGIAAMVKAAGGTERPA
jgi:hypothetical protein